MKKILSVLLSLCMVLSLFSAFAVLESAAAGETYESDEYDGAALGFSLSVKDSRGLNGAMFNSGAPASDIYALYNADSFDDSFGKHKADGSEGDSSDWTYDVFNYNEWITGSANLVCGGFWSSKVSSDLPISRFPIDIDINLGGVRETSGIRLYARTDDAPGFVTKYEVYVKFDGDDDWTYLYTDSNSSGSKKDVTTPFAGNMNVTDIRVRVLDTSSKVDAGTEIAQGTPAYFYLNKIRVLKPYNNGGAKYDNAPLTYNSKDELDELSVVAENAKFKGDGWSVEESKTAMDDDLGTASATNGFLTVDFGHQVSFSGFRYYPPKNSKFQGITRIGDFGFLPKEFTLDYSSGDPNGRASWTEAEVIKTDTYINPQFVYPLDSEGNYDYTKPITVKFGRNVIARGLYVNSWNHVDGTAGWGGVGEIRLIKAEPNDHFTEYYSKEDVLPWSEDSSPYVPERGKTGATGTLVGKANSLFDRIIYYSSSECDPNNSDMYIGNDYALQDGGTAWFTVDLGEEYTFSAVRIFGRFKNWDQAVKEGKIYFSDDGETWSEGYFFADDYSAQYPGREIAQYASTGDIYTDIGLTLGTASYNVTARYIKIEATKSGSDHFAAQEIMLVKPKEENETVTVSNLPTDASHGYYLKEDVLKWSETTTPSVTDHGQTGTAGAFRYSVPNSIFDKVIYIQQYEYPGTVDDSYKTFLAYEHVLKDGNTGWITIDLGEEYTFSAVRIFGRHNNFNQSIKEGNLYFSDDGVSWSAPFESKDDYTGVYPNTYMVKYNSTGDIYTDMGVNDGESSYNVTARYVKLEVTKTAGDHFAIGELMLVKPKAEYETKDVASLNAIFTEKAASVVALIEAIGTVGETSGDKIDLARAAYDALPDYAKTLVTNYSVLTAAEAAYAEYKLQSIINMIDALPAPSEVSASDEKEVSKADSLYSALPEELKASVTNASKLSEVKAALSGLIYTLDMSDPLYILNGLKCAEFSMTVPDGVTVDSIVFNGTEYTEDGKWFEQSAAAGKINLKLTGSYAPVNYAHWDQDTVGGYLEQGKKVWARQDLPKMGIANGEEITLGKGKLTNMIAKFNPIAGDNFVTVKLSDGSERDVNLKTTNVKFTTLTYAGSTGAVDELAPNSTWKAATTAGGWIQRAFDGVTDSTNPENFWETNYVAGKYQLEGQAEANNVIFYGPAPFTFYVDMGDNTTPYSGMRFYPRTNSLGSNVGIVDVYGVDSLDEEWTLLGTYDLTGQDWKKPLNLTFFEDEHTVNYKYIRCNVSRNLNNSGNMNIAGITFVKPAVMVKGSDVFTVDIDDSLVSEAEFTFNMKTATSLTSVKKDGAELAASVYTFDTDKLTFTLDYVKTLPEGKTEFDLTFDNGDTVEVYIERVAITVADYYITGTKSGTSINAGKGTNELVLTAPGTKQASKLEIGSYNMDFTQDGSQITVQRYNFRGYEGLFDAYINDGFVMVKVTFNDGIVVNYKVNLYGATYKLTNEFLDASKFESDEIVSKTTWAVKVDSENYGTNVAVLFGQHNFEVLWHTGFTFVDGNAVGDTTNGHYLDVDLGELTEFSGLRYYKRNSGTQTTGTWQEVTVYGRNSENEDWAVINDKTTLKWDYTTETYKDIAFDGTAKCRYIRIKITGGSAHATAAYLRLLKPKASFENAEVVNDPVPMDFDLNENANAKLSLNDSKAIKKVMQGGSEVASEYLEITGDVISISPYYFIDNGYESGDKVEFTVSFAFGNDVSFKVELGSVDGYVFTYSAGANGSVTASAYNEAIGIPENKTSGSKVRNTDKLTFTAVADEGYEVDSWSVVSTTPIYERIPDSAKKKWSAKASSEQPSDTAAKMLDGNTADNNFWHSRYFVEDDGATVYPDPNLPYELTFDFGGTVKHANAFTYLPRVWGGAGVKDYELYVMEDGKDDWTLVKTGTITTAQNKMAEITLDFGGVYDITQLKYVITSTHTGYAYIREVYLSAEKLPSGTVTRVGTGSEDFQIDDRFTDMEVTATFKKMAEGKANVSSELTNLKSDAPVTAQWGKDLVVTLTPEYGYLAPLADKVSVTKDGVLLIEGVDYVYDRTSDEEGTLTVKNVSGKKIVITASAKDYINHKVTYIDNYGATGALPETKDVIEGEEFTVEKSSLKLAGYKFVGWSYEDVVYQAGDKLEMGTYDITFEAVWEKDNSQKDETGETEKPSSSGGSSKKPSSGGSGGGIGGGATGSYSITINGTTTKAAVGTIVPEPAAREGYTFRGYYLDAALTVPYANTGVKENVTLYPSWVKNRSRADLTDIKGHWAENYIGDLYESFLINGTGDGAFNPDSDITRAEFVQILYNMSKMTSDGSQSFEDVKSGDWFSQAVAWAVNYGITSGTSDSTFSPYEKITREQMAAMIYRYATLMGADWQTDENSEFTDNSEIADYAKYQVRWAKGSGIISGRPDGSFGPKDNATRAESAAMLSRLVK